LSTPTHPSETRLLLAEETQFVSDKLRDSLLERGFQVQVAESGAEAIEIVRSWRPHFVLYDMVMPDLLGPAFLKKVKADGFLADDKTHEGRSHVFVMSSHNSTANVKECLKSGASDYLVKPVKIEDLVSRLILHLQTKRQVSEVKAGDDSDSGRALHYLHLTELMLRESLKLAPTAKALYNLVGMLSLATDAVRVSVIEANLGASEGTVRASNDKKDIDGLKLDLTKYPEVMFVLRSEKTLALDNLKADTTMSAIVEQTKSISFNAMLVCPIRIGSEVWGVVSVRLPETKKILSDFEIRFAQLTTHVVANVIARETARKAA
jgi:DNA-binding response OmpR family regulator